jgi:hypothetical protein
VGADDHNFASKYRVLAGNLRDHVVAVEIARQVGRAELEPQLRDDAGLHHPYDHVVVLRHHDDRGHGAVGRLRAAADRQRAVQLRAGAKDRTGTELLEQRRHGVGRYN